MSLGVRPAMVSDAELIHSFICELAAYERLAHEATATREDIERALFGEAPKAFCDLVLVDGEPAGFALWFYNFSTFMGRHGLYLEDLYVRPAARGRGAGRALLSHLAARCLTEELGRMEWSVLEWNIEAVGFYDALGAVSMEDWRIRRLSGEALARLGGSLN